MDPISSNQVKLDSSSEEESSRVSAIEIVAVPAIEASQKQAYGSKVYFSRAEVAVLVGGSINIFYQLGKMQARNTAFRSAKVYNDETMLNILDGVGFAIQLVAMCSLYLFIFTRKPHTNQI